MVERLRDLRREPPRHDEQDTILENPDGQDDLDLAVGVEQRRATPLSRSERLDLVGEERVEKRGAIAAGDLESAPVAPVCQRDATARGGVLAGRVPVIDRQLPVADRLDARARGEVTIVERQSAGHAFILNPRATLRAVKLPPAPRIRRFQRRLLAWYGVHRRDLPWRRTRRPYRVLVSEIMLQQTQVDRVIPKYLQFLRRYPTIRHLARARVEEVRRLWYPLGYNIRPVRLHAIARETVARYAGRLPDDEEALRRLPGIGRYTAGAVRAFAYGRDAAVLDTNVRRVLGRVFLGPRRLARVRGQKTFWDLAEALLPPGRAYDFNQALMDFGATWCTPRKPQCPRCPMRGFCATVATSAS